MRIIFLTTGDERVGSTRYRALQWIPLLEKRGWSVDWIFARHIRARKFVAIVKKVRKADVVFIQKKLFTKLFLRFIRMLNKRIIYDFDDALYTNTSFSEKVSALGPGWRKTKRRLKYALKSASTVIAGSAHLAKYASAFNTNVNLVPTTILNSDYREILRREQEKIAIGWIGIADNHFYLKKMSKTLKTISDKYAEVTIKVISDKKLEIEGIKIDNVKWHIENYRDHISSFQIGIMPLTDDEWSRGKCAFKLIQYMGAGLPVVASNVGANPSVVTDGVDGFLVSSHDEWVDRLGRLIESRSLRLQMGKAARKKIRDEFSVESWAERFESILLAEVL